MFSNVYKYLKNKQNRRKNATYFYKYFDNYKLDQIFDPKLPSKLIICLTNNCIDSKKKKEEIHTHHCKFNKIITPKKPKK